MKEAEASGSKMDAQENGTEGLLSHTGNQPMLTIRLLHPDDFFFFLATKSVPINQTNLSSPFHA